MNVRQAVAALGGPLTVGRQIGVQISAVSNWSSRDRVAARHLATFWSMCADAGIAWAPPGGEGRVPTREAAA